MSVIAVVNSKGGSGKSTLATHVASWLANRGEEVMLGDIDRLQSSRLWLTLRKPEHARIHGWSVDEKNFARPPAGVRHVVLDTPGGFHGFGLMKVTMNADAILIPAGPGVFDRNSAIATLRELRGLPRIAAGKCSVACVGMRIDVRTRNAEVVRKWAEANELHWLGTIRMAQAYTQFLERGLSVFDLPPESVSTLLSDWEPLTCWLQAVLASGAPQPGSHGSREELLAGRSRAAMRPILGAR